MNQTNRSAVCTHINAIIYTTYLDTFMLFGFVSNLALQTFQSDVMSNSCDKIPFLLDKNFLFRDGNSSTEITPKVCPVW